MTSFPSGGAYVIEDTETGSSRFSSSNTQNVIAIEVPVVSGGNGAVGLTGATGPGVATGGTTGQFLTKDSGTDYDTSWATIHQVPAGGATAEVLGKASGSDYDLEWVAQVPASTSVYVYDSSAIQEGNTYSSWSDLITQVNSVDGPKIIQFAQDETIPTGSWNLARSVLVGNSTNISSPVTVTFPTGCTISNPAGTMASDGIILYSTSNSAVLTVSSARTVALNNAAYVASKTAAFITVSATSGIVSFLLSSSAGFALPSDLWIAGGDYESINVTGAGVTVLVVDDHGRTGLYDDTIRGGAGVGTTITRVVFHPAGTVTVAPGDTQTNATNWSVSLATKANRVGFDGDGSGEAVFTGIEEVDSALVALASASALPAAGTSGNLLTSNGTAWTSAADRLPAASTSGNLLTSNGTSWTSTADRLPAASTSGNILTSNGTSWTSASHSLGSVVVPLWVPTSTNGTWGPSSAFDYTFNSTPVDGHWIEWSNIPLGGTYTIGCAVQQTNGAPKYQVSVDGVDVGSLQDAYAGSTTAVVQTSTGISITAGLHTVRVTINGKNASSSGYGLRLASIAFSRTS